MKILENDRARIEPDDQVEIWLSRGLRVRGIVLSAYDYGPGERMIEYHIQPGGKYGYWKQPSDGGHLVKVNGQEINEFSPAQ